MAGDMIRDRTIGRICYCLGVYCDDLREIEHECQVGDDRVRFRDRLFATFTWPEDPKGNRPIFEFVGAGLDNDTERCFRWTRNQYVRRPYLNNHPALLTIEQTIIAIGNALTLNQAYSLRWLRRKENLKQEVQWYQFDEIRRVVEQAASEGSHGYIQSDADWRHLANCAIYDI